MPEPSSSSPSLLCLLLLLAFDPQLRVQAPTAIGVADELRPRQLPALAEVFRVDQDAALARLELQFEPAHRRVGDRREGAADAALEGVDATGDVDLDSVPAQGKDEIGQ